MASFFSRIWQSLRTLLTNRYFWGGLLVLFFLAAGVYFLFNHLVMPSYTRHDVAVTIPDVMNLPVQEAQARLEEEGLRVEIEKQRYNPNFPHDAVVDQAPGRNAYVKPGRPVKLIINSSSTPKVAVPTLAGMSLREAENRLMASGLKLREARPDSIPSPYPNTVTRQQPAPGDSLQEGSSVTLWYSTGLGDAYVTVPEVTGMTVQEAQQLLLQRKLRSVVVGAETSPEADPAVARQSREPGTRVREGFEIRLFVGEQEDLEEAPEDL